MGAAEGGDPMEAAGWMAGGKDRWKRFSSGAICILVITHRNEAKQLPLQGMLQAFGRRMRLETSARTFKLHAQAWLASLLASARGRAGLTTKAAGASRPSGHEFDGTREAGASGALAHVWRVEALF